MKFKTAICAAAIGALLFAQASFATQATQADSSAAQSLPQTEGAAPEEAAQNEQMPQDFEGRMPRKGGMGPPPGGMRGDGGEMPPTPPDMQAPQQPDEQTDNQEALQEQMPQQNEGYGNGQMPGDNTMRGQMPPGGRGEGFDSAMQNDAAQGDTAEESFAEKNLTFLISLAALILGFVFVIFYKRKTF